MQACDAIPVAIERVPFSVPLSAVTASLTLTLVRHRNLNPQERSRARAEARMADVMSSLMKHKHAGLFLAPVDPRTAPGYEKYVQTPMDLGTIDRKLRTGG